MDTVKTHRWEIEFRNCRQPVLRAHAAALEAAAAFDAIQPRHRDVEHGEQIDARLVELARGTDLLGNDVQYTAEEL
jgi:hypothetical protein